MPSTTERWEDNILKWPQITYRSILMFTDSIVTDDEALRLIGTPIMIKSDAFFLKASRRRDQWLQNEV